MVWLLLILVVAAAAVAIAWFNGRRADRTPEEVVKYLRDFIEGTGGEWDWDDFTSVPIKDGALEQIRQAAEHVELLVQGMGMDRLRALLAEAEALVKR